MRLPWRSTARAGGDEPIDISSRLGPYGAIFLQAMEMAARFQAQRPVTSAEDASPPVAITDAARRAS